MLAGPRNFKKLSNFLRLFTYLAKFEMSVRIPGGDCNTLLLLPPYSYRV
jgi:hypothetical protein